MSLAPTAEGARAASNLSTLLRLAWPIVVSRSTQTIVGLTDALMIAHLGKEALAATTTGAMNAMALFILPMGTVFIVSSFAAQFFGRGDATGARRFAFYGLLVAAVTQGLAFLSPLAIDPAIGLFGFEPEVERLLKAYLVIRLLSGGAVVGQEALANYYGGLGNTRLPMIVNLCSMVLNVFGNWVLIDGRLGMPALGVAGAAWASAIASIVSFLGFFAFFLAEGRRTGRVLPRLRADEWWRTLRFGLPSGLNWFFEFFGFLFFVNVVVAGLGTTALAAMMGVMQLNSVAFMPAFAIASAGAIVVGQAIGAKAHDEVPAAVRRTFLLAGTWQGLVGVAFVAVPAILFAPLARGEGSEELLAVGARMLSLSAAWMLFDAAATTLAEALRAAGDTAFTLWARVVLAWGVFVPGGWISVRLLGGDELVALFWLTAYLALLAAVLWWRFRRGTWRLFDLVGEHPTR